MKLLNSFLDYVDREKAHLLIIGDFLELWHCRLDSILRTHVELFDRFAQTDCTYILGNHDDELPELLKESSPHSFFEKISEPFIQKIGNKKFKFMHGHEVDPFIRKRSKTICRVFNPVLEIFQSNSDSATLTYDIFSDLVLEFGEAFLAVWKWLSEQTKRATDDCLAVLPNDELAFLKRHSRTKKMLRRYREDLHEGLYDVAIVGHTHKAGRFGNWYFNSGSWTGHRNNYLCIQPDGKIEVFDWDIFGPQLNSTHIGH